jgi:hypothetical protein
MDLVTVACQRDIQDLLLQAHTIDKFIDKPCRHWITVEDESLTPEEWHGLLAQYYTRHKLFLAFPKRPPNDDRFYEPFNLGWRNQQRLKLLTGRLSDSDRVMVLDAKNFFIRATDLDAISIRHGNGRYTTELPPMAKLWHDYLCEELKLPSPSVYPAPLSTPTIYDVSILRDMNIEDIFEREVVPAGEVLYYFFHVADFDPPSDILLGAVRHNDNPNDIVNHIRKAQNSFTHGLHRRARKEMNDFAKSLYTDWLISLGLNSTLVNDYVYYMMTDETWGK